MIPCCVEWLNLAFVAEKMEELDRNNHGAMTCQRFDWLPRWQPVLFWKKLLRFQVFVQDREDLSQYREYRERIEFLLGNQMLEGMKSVHEK